MLPLVPSEHEWIILFYFFIFYFCICFKNAPDPLVDFFGIWEESKSLYNTDSLKVKRNTLDLGKTLEIYSEISFH